MIGLSGSHRVGKTSLARAYAEKNGLKFVETSASQVFKDMGLDPAVRYDFSTRLTVQEEILKRFDVEYAKHCHSDMAIADRTPLDLLGYTMADAVQDAVPEHEQKRFAKYVRDCFDVVNRRFSVLIVVQPGIELVAAEGKASPNMAYIEHLNSLIIGLSVDERVKVAHFYVPRRVTDMEERVSAVEYAVARTCKRVEDEREDAIMH